MSYKHLVLLSLFTALSTQAGEVSFEEKQNRVEFLEDLHQKVPAMDIDAYRRELQYEKLNLSVAERARSEAQLMAEQIKTQIVRAYEASLTSKTQEEAAAEIRQAIEKDAALLAPELRHEIRTLSLSTLEELVNGRISTDTDLQKVEKVLMKSAQDRYEFLNEEGEDVPLSAFSIDPTLPRANTSRDSEKKEYASRAELVESLASENENVRWVSSGGVTLKSAVTTKREANVSMQVKAEFLGVSLSAGPSFSFSRQFDSSVQVMAEGMNPVLLPDGNFDFYKRDKSGNMVKKDGKPVRRFINFYCDVSLEFATEAKAGGGFSVAGVGGGVSVTSTYKNNVDMTSRRVLVPEYIDGKTATFRDLNEICTNDFRRARITNNLTVEQSLNLMMKNVVASLRYSHPKTKCARDQHCFKWFNDEVIPLVKIQNFPRCVEESREKYYMCALRGLKGQNCAVYDRSGKRISDGMFEFQCDVGLRCVKYQEAGWFKNWELYQFAKGKCLPVNAKTYRSPFELLKEKDYVEVFIK